MHEGRIPDILIFPSGIELIGLPSLASTLSVDDHTLLPNISNKVTLNPQILISEYYIHTI
jgi:hypothetical protein